MFKILFFIILMFFLAGCNSTNSIYTLDKENKIVKVDIEINRELLSGRTKITTASIPLKNIDFETFDNSSIANKNYAKDKNFVYFKGVTIPLADPESFQLIAHNISKDKNHMYFKNTIISGFSPYDYEIVYDEDLPPPLFDGKYIKSGSLIFVSDDFFEETKFKPCDINTFEVLFHGVYSKDSQCVYYKGRKIDVDLKTFDVVELDYAKDKDRCYRYGYVADCKTKRVSWEERLDDNREAKLNQKINKIISNIKNDTGIKLLTPKLVNNIDLKNLRDNFIVTYEVGLFYPEYFTIFNRGDDSHIFIKHKNSILSENTYYGANLKTVRNKGYNTLADMVSGLATESEFKNCINKDVNCTKTKTKASIFYYKDKTWILDTPSTGIKEIFLLDEYAFPLVYVKYKKLKSKNKKTKLKILDYKIRSEYFN